MSLSALTRSKNLTTLQNQVFDLLIIGGGINGAGIARDAASRGMKVALIEAKDFAIGTSSRSSKLIHGGIRYLENMEFGLVFEALSERRRLFELAPHLVHPLRFAIPVYKGGRVSPWLMGLGMFLYDALALFETPEPAARMSEAEVKEHLPLLSQKNLQAVFAYSDAYMDDDRLVIETLRSAARFGALAVNYVRAEGATHTTDGKIQSVQATDQLGGQKLTIRAHHFVSTVGPWTDLVAPNLLPDWRPHMRPSKGVHLTFTRERLPLQQAVVMGAEQRIVFGIPRHEMVIVGTTDTDFTADPYSVHTTREDVQYLLQVIDHYFPAAQIKERDIVASYSGVRPLVDDQSATESKTSREHQILTDARGLTVVMGGKYTTYRLMAEQAVESCLGQFSFEEQMQFQKSRTLEPLNPLITSDLYTEKELGLKRLLRDFDQPVLLLRALFERHGTEGAQILQKYADDMVGLNNWEEKLWALEAAHAIHQTACQNVADFLLRRTPLVLSRADHGRPVIEAVSRVFQRHLGLSDAELNKQIKAWDEEMKQEMGWRV
ncbi:MAG: glycerol-3-phosphate dehydrogenase/oxidase [Bdellovibrionales bacterium]